MTDELLPEPSDTLPALDEDELLPAPRETVASLRDEQLDDWISRSTRYLDLDDEPDVLPRPRSAPQLRSGHGTRSSSLWGRPRSPVSIRSRSPNSLRHDDHVPFSTFGPSKAQMYCSQPHRDSPSYSFGRGLTRSNRDLSYATDSGRSSFQYSHCAPPIPPEQAALGLTNHYNLNVGMGRTSRGTSELRAVTPPLSHDERRSRWSETARGNAALRGLLRSRRSYADDARWYDRDSRFGEDWRDGALRNVIRSRAPVSDRWYDDGRDWYAPGRDEVWEVIRPHPRSMHHALRPVRSVLDYQPYYGPSYVGDYAARERRHDYARRGFDSYYHSYNAPRRSVLGDGPNAGVARRLARGWRRGGARPADVYTDSASDYSVASYDGRYRRANGYDIDVRAMRDERGLYRRRHDMVRL